MVVNARVFRANPNSLKPMGISCLVLGLLLSGCAFRREVAPLERLRTRIEDQTGSKASVNVRSAYGSTTVTIRFAQLPAGDSKLLQQQVEALTRIEFPKTDYVVVLTNP